MKKNRIAQLMLASSIMVSTNVFAACYGNVYSMNAGRGHVGALIDLKESASLDNNYFQNASERAVINSKALFSSSAMAYDENTNRIYYSNVPTPTAYHINDTETFFSDDELASLDFHAKSSERFKLAYYDVATGEHVEVANTKYQIMRMAFSPETGELYASDANRLFTVNPTSGETTQIALFPTGPRNGGFTNWGDFEFYKGELLFVTNGRSYSVDLTTADLTLKAFHFVDFVSSVTTDQNGQLIMAAKNQNVSGNVNNNRLWRFNPSTGEKVQVGLFPTRISAMATVTSEEHTCYDATVFESQKVTVESLTNDGAKKSEGTTGEFSVSLEEATTDETTIRAALVDGTATGGQDYNRQVTVSFLDSSGNQLTSRSQTLSNEGDEISLPTGTKDVTFTVSYLSDSNVESDETVTFQVWGQQDRSDIQESTVTIAEPDQTLAVSSITVDGLAPEGGFFWGTTVTLNKVVTEDTPRLRFLLGSGSTSTAEEDRDFANNFAIFRFFTANDQLISESTNLLLDSDNGHKGNPSVMNIPAGTQYIKVGILIAGDSIKEADETFNAIVALQHGFTDLKVAVVTIKDDD
ncbi:YncE family protein [Enterovibrio baiacu]|uniref:YncE family protein n=1 Tax=Enterovibrio baiacu TaxID=2491023 RepID=UPI0010137E70|nr:hypothetical protein [Enterovibrio baiacu]MBE1273777.1 hypothetical protein [Enterovibrio baiacu]